MALIGLVFDLNDTYTPPPNTLINEGLGKYPLNKPITTRSIDGLPL